MSEQEGDSIEREIRGRERERPKNPLLFLSQTISINKILSLILIQSAVVFNEENEGHTILIKKIQMMMMIIWIY